MGCVEVCDGTVWYGTGFAGNPAAKIERDVYNLRQRLVS